MVSCYGFPLRFPFLASFHGFLVTVSVMFFRYVFSTAIRKSIRGHRKQDTLTKNYKREIIGNLEGETINDNGWHKKSPAETWCLVMVSRYGFRFWLPLMVFSLWFPFRFSRYGFSTAIRKSIKGHHKEDSITKTYKRETVNRNDQRETINGSHKQQTINEKP